MVDVARATKLIGKLSALKFFPGDPVGQKAVLEIVCNMASETEQIDWLVRRALVLYNEWPGPRELRALFCSRWKPIDGQEAYSTVYISDEHGGGFPAESPRPAPLLTPGKDEARKMLNAAAGWSKQ